MAKVTAETIEFDKRWKLTHFDFEVPKRSKRYTPPKVKAEEAEVVHPPFKFEVGEIVRWGDGSNQTDVVRERAHGKVIGEDVYRLNMDGWNSEHELRKIEEAKDHYIFARYEGGAEALHGPFTKWDAIGHKIQWVAMNSEVEYEIVREGDL